MCCKSEPSLSQDPWQARKAVRRARLGRRHRHEAEKKIFPDPP
eukprot:CAMPEP_0185818860 /NCGR_PEP_ID=MMETSP1322-20130828/21297_1 /TAXON_ID=265543 /ORGANISM="Minutocellus polymorphus, Strain RCC2270" /LENGTH=42 /DNA_ID= /DNA_START= /DNA_END= /DNA_ORIENTATION=